jgi:dephospho-CoA kinase
VGPAASGKGKLIDALVKRGFMKISLSDEIRRDLEELHPGKQLAREDFQDLGDDRRKTLGHDYWAKRAGARLSELADQGHTKFVIDSFRNPAEVLWFKKTFNMAVIGVDAPLELRIKWAVKRARDIDKTADEERLRRDFERDIGLNQPEYGQQVAECISLSDNLIINDGPLAELDRKIDETLLSVGIEGSAPNGREMK